MTVALILSVALTISTTQNFFFMCGTIRRIPVPPTSPALRSRKADGGFHRLARSRPTRKSSSFAFQLRRSQRGNNQKSWPGNGKCLRIETCGHTFQLVRKICFGDRRYASAGRLEWCLAADRVSDSRRTSME